MRSLVVAALVTLSTALAHAGHKPAAILVPPMGAELGASAPLGEATPLANSTELRVGFHTASLYWKPTRFDVGIGFVGSWRSMPGMSYVARGSDVIVDDTQDVSLGGLYASFAYAIERHRNWRTWVGARVDNLHGDYRGRSLNVVGGSVRLSAELFSAGVHGAGDRNALAFMAGAWALGVYVEGTARTLPDELGPLSVGAGVTMRVPFLLAVAN